MTKLKKGLIILGSLLVITTVYLTDQYFYSWAGLFSNKIGACESKLIKASSSNKDGFKKLIYPIDLDESAVKLKSNPHYNVVQTENSLNISRIYDNLRYTIIFENRVSEGIKSIYYQYSIDCPHCESPVYGEKCTVPDFELYKKVYWIIEDLTSGEKTKSELLSGLAVYHQNSAPTVLQ